MRKIGKLGLIVLLFVLIVGCSVNSNTEIPVPVIITEIETEEPLVTITTEPTETTVPTPTTLPTLVYDEDWKKWPVIPTEVSPAMKQLFQEGLLAGNDPHRLGKIGDCQNIPLYFLGGLDREGRSTLGENNSLQQTVDWYKGSWNRWPPSVHGGQNIVAVQIENPIMKFEDNYQDQCNKGEAYIDCEIRLWNPSVAVVSFEELWDGKTDVYAKWYESLIVKLLDHKIVPILAMTAKNEAANQIIADLAVKYQLPVWNLWTPLQSLKNHGIRDDFHLTIWGDIFDFTVVNNRSGWHVRNITALQAIDAVRTELFYE